MTTLSNHYFLRVDLTLKNLTTASTETHIFIDQMLTDSSLGASLLWPILLEVGDIGAVMSNYLPGSVATSFSIDNKIGSFGFQRKFSDKFQRFTAINQTASFYYGVAALPGAGPPSPASWTLLFSGKIKSFTNPISEDENRLTFQVDSQPLDRVIPSYQITRQKFPSAPDASIGKSIPIVFGEDVEVLPIEISGSLTAPRYLYGLWLNSGVAPAFPLGTVGKYFTKNLDGDYDEVLSAATTSTVLYSTTGSLAAGADDYYTEIQAVGDFISDGSSAGYVLTHIKVKFRGTGNGAWAGGSSIRIGVWRDQYNALPSEEVAFGEALKSSYNTSFQGAVSSTFDITFALNKPVVIGGAFINFYVVFSQGYNAGMNGGAGDFVDYFNISGAGQEAWSRGYDSGGNSSFYHETGLTDVNFYWEAFGVKYGSFGLGSANAIAPGYSYYYIDLEQQAAPSFQDNPEISRLPLILELNGGLADDTTGIITGTPNQFITRAHHIAKFFTLALSGGVWGLDGSFDDSAYSGTHSIAFTGSAQLSRSIAGRAEGRSTLTQLLNNIFRNSASRLAYRRNGKIGVWAWGTYAASPITIPQEDIKILSVRFGGVDTVINAARLVFGRTFKFSNFESAFAQGLQFKDYQFTLDFSQTAPSSESYYSAALALTLASSNLYGEREIGQPSFEWVNDIITAESIARYLVSVYAFPLIEIEAQVPLEKYSSLELLDTVKINSVLLPSYLGAWGQQLAAIYQDSMTVSATDPSRGAYTPRLETYRCQIEGTNIRFNQQRAPVLNLVLRLINNYPADMT